MPSLRIEAEDQGTVAVDELTYLSALVPELRVTTTAPRTVSLGLAEASWSADVIPVDSVGLTDAARLTHENPDLAIVVGNKISEDARSHLSNAGWSWFDRRTGAHIVHGTHTLDIRFVAADLTPELNGPALPLASPRSDGPIRGRAGISYAATLLLTPEKPPSFRAIAREIGMSPTAISNAAKLLEAQGLAVDKQPSLPDLFWALAGIWRPAKIAFVKELPHPTNQQLTYELDQLDTEGWAAAGDRAALELGAPLFATDDRPFFWVPTQTEMRRAQRTLGNTDRENGKAIVAVAPTLIVCTRRLPTAKGLDPWPLAHPLFLALDLARDPGRGHEILDKWKPEGIARVWA